MLESEAYKMARPFIIDKQIRSRHCVICSWLKTSGQSLDKKSQNMQVKTPQSKPVEIENGQQSH
jgi:hypothetical protein